MKGSVLRSRIIRLGTTVAVATGLLMAWTVAAQAVTFPSRPAVGQSAQPASPLPPPPPNMKGTAGGAGQVPSSAGQYSPGTVTCIPGASMQVNHPLINAVSGYSTELVGFQLVEDWRPTSSSSWSYVGTTQYWMGYATQTSTPSSWWDSATGQWQPISWVGPNLNFVKGHGQYYVGTWFYWWNSSGYLLTYQFAWNTSYAGGSSSTGCTN